MDTALRVTNFQPWSEMSAETQARHLVEDHGFDVDNFGVGEMRGRLATNEDVVRAFTTIPSEWMEPIAGGESYPCAEGRDGYHQSDHGDDDSLLSDAVEGINTLLGVHVHAPDGLTREAAIKMLQEGNES